MISNRLKMDKKVDQNIIIHQLIRHVIHWMSSLLYLLTNHTPLLFLLP